MDALLAWALFCGWILITFNHNYINDCQRYKQDVLCELSLFSWSLWVLFIIYQCESNIQPYLKYMKTNVKAYTVIKIPFKYMHYIIIFSQIIYLKDPFSLKCNKTLAMNMFLRRWKKKHTCRRHVKTSPVPPNPLRHQRVNEVKDVLTFFFVFVSHEDTVYLKSVFKKMHFALNTNFFTHAI